MENHHFSWENSLFLASPFSIALLVITRGYLFIGPATASVLSGEGVWQPTATALPSGNDSHSCGSSPFFMQKKHYFDWAILQFAVLNYQRVDSSFCHPNYGEQEKNDYSLLTYKEEQLCIHPRMQHLSSCIRAFHCPICP